MKATVIVALSIAISNDGVMEIIRGVDDHDGAKFIAGIIKSALYIVALVFVCIGM
jgi:hypothetical protein